MSPPHPPPGHSPETGPVRRFGYLATDGNRTRRPLFLIGAGHVVVLICGLVLAAVVLVDGFTPDPGGARRTPGQLSTTGLNLALLAVALLGVVAAQVLALRRVRELARAIGSAHADVDAIAYSLRRAGHPIACVLGGTVLALPALVLAPPPPTLLVLLQLTAAVSLLLNTAAAGWACRLLIHDHAGGTDRPLPPGAGATLRNQQLAMVGALGACVAVAVILAVTAVVIAATNIAPDPLRAGLAGAAAIGVALLPVPLIRASSTLGTSIDGDRIRLPPLRRTGTQLIRAAIIATAVQALATTAALSTPTPGVPAALGLALLVLTHAALALQLASLGRIYLADLP